MLLVVALTFVALVGAVACVGTLLSAPSYNGHESPNFNGQIFVNPEPVEEPNLRRALRLLLSERGSEWDEWRELEDVPSPVSRLGTGIRATFINHATILVQMDGTNVLTDPIYSERASAFTQIGPKRRHPPGIELEKLPPIDLVIVSHNHYDHMNLPTLARLRDRDDPMFVVGLGNGALLRSNDFQKVRELDWDEALSSGDVEIVAQRARHRSGRGFRDQNANLWVSFVVKGPSGSVYFAGDTGYGSHFAETAEHHGPIDLALLPISAYGPEWFMRSFHMNPDDAVRAHLDLRARASLAMHFGTFRLSTEGQDEPVRALREAREARDVSPEAFQVLRPGHYLQLGID